MEARYRTNIVARQTIVMTKQSACDAEFYYGFDATKEGLAQRRKAFGPVVETRGGRVIVLHSE